ASRTNWPAVRWWTKPSVTSHGNGLSSVGGLACTEAEEVGGDRRGLFLAVGVVFRPQRRHVVARLDGLRVHDPLGDVLERGVQDARADRVPEPEVGEVRVAGLAVAHGLGVVVQRVAADAALLREERAALADLLVAGDVLDDRLLERAHPLLELRLLLNDDAEPHVGVGAKAELCALAVVDARL